jgi:transcriptional regulator with XRE-family HTH domain
MRKTFSPEIMENLSLKYKTAGQFIKGYRYMLGLSLEEIAEACGVWRHTISSIEKEKTIPDFNLMLKILKFLRKKGSPEINLYALSSPKKL